MSKSFQMNAQDLLYKKDDCKLMQKQIIYITMEFNIMICTTVNIGILFNILTSGNSKTLENFNPFLSL